MTLNVLPLFQKNKLEIDSVHKRVCVCVCVCVCVIEHKNVQEYVQAYKKVMRIFILQ